MLYVIEDLFIVFIEMFITLVICAILATLIYVFMIVPNKDNQTNKTQTRKEPEGKRSEGAGEQQRRAQNPYQSVNNNSEGSVENIMMGLASADDKVRKKAHEDLLKMIGKDATSRKNGTGKSYGTGAPKEYSQANGYGKSSYMGGYTDFDDECDDIDDVDSKFADAHSFGGAESYTDMTDGDTIWARGDGTYTGYDGHTIEFVDEHTVYDRDAGEYHQVW